MASPNLQIASAMQYLYDHQKPKTVATVWARDNESAATQGKFARQWFEGKTKLLPEESVLASDTDFSALATKLTSENPDVLTIAGGSEANASSLVLQTRQAGLRATTTMAGQGFLRMAGKMAEGTLAPSDYLLDNDLELNRSFVDAYKKKYGSDPDNESGLGYTAMLSMLHAIKMAGGASATPQQVRDALVKTKDLPAVIGTGSFSLDADRQPNYKMAIIVVKDGKWTRAPE